MVLDGRPKHLKLLMSQGLERPLFEVVQKTLSCLTKVHEPVSEISCDFDGTRNESIDEKQGVQKAD